MPDSISPIPDSSSGSVSKRRTDARHHGEKNTESPEAVLSDSTSGSKSDGKQKPWSIADSAQQYGINRWGKGYFGISAGGNVTMQAPVDDRTVQVELTEIIDGLQQRGLNMPVMLRFENLVDDRISRLNLAFQNAIRESGYRGTYRGVFPVKVNQQSHVVNEIARAGATFGHGIEAGSKAELLIAIATLPVPSSGSDTDGGLIVCNGFKDAEFVDLGLQAIRLGFKCFFVIETQGELELILQRSQHWKVRPLIGARLKLSTRVDGHWSNDSGDRSLFGMTTTELIRMVDLLRSEEMLDCLQMLHFHLGSQIPNIRNIREGLAEACRYYIDLARDGVPLAYFNLGGGLAVNYDGNASTDVHSRNYDLEEYCIDSVESVMDSFDAHGIEHPVLITESGRWTVAPMSVLLFNILSVTNFDAEPLPDAIPDGIHEAMESLTYTLEHIELRRLQENYNDAIYARDKLREAFRGGTVNLRDLALGENICLTVLARVAELVPQMERPPRELQSLGDSLADIYYGNFSIFQSLPDAWAIGQVFPVMPLHRLNKQPDRRAIIADLTCDCDGKLDQFIGPDGEVAPTLKLHKIKPDQDYILGAFLVGAYQETLGDLHNLFGDTNVASVRVTSEGRVEFVHELHGDSISDVLSYVEYQPQELYQRFHSTAEAAVREGRISVAQRQQMLTLFRESLDGYTYFEN